MEMTLQNLLQNCVPGVVQQNDVTGKNITSLSGEPDNFLFMINEKTGMTDSNLFCEEEKADIDDQKKKGGLDTFVNRLTPEVFACYHFTSMPQIQRAYSPNTFDLGNRLTVSGVSVDSDVLEGKDVFTDSNVTNVFTASDKLPVSKTTAVLTGNAGTAVEKHSAVNNGEADVPEKIVEAAQSPAASVSQIQDKTTHADKPVQNKAFYVYPEIRQSRLIQEVGIDTAKAHLEAPNQTLNLKVDHLTGSEEQMKINVSESQDIANAVPVSKQPILVNTDYVQMNGTEAASETNKTSDLEFVENTARLLQKAIKSGRREIEVQLEPEHLGKILVKTVYEADAVSVFISCDSEKALSLIAHHASELSNILYQNVGGDTAVFIDEQPQSTWNPDEGENGSRQHNQEQHKKKHAPEYDDDFLQQLRLGIT